MKREFKTAEERYQAYLALRRQCEAKGITFTYTDRCVRGKRALMGEETAREKNIRMMRETLRLNLRKVNIIRG